jgi:hypothetical protein
VLGELGAAFAPDSAVPLEDFGGVADGAAVLPALE